MNLNAYLQGAEEVKDRQISLELDYVLKFQPHCDRYLEKIASPKGKSVLVIGCGFGTEMLWCIRNCAEEVVGLDNVERNTKALELAISRYDIKDPPPFKMLELPVEEAGKLDMRFDLVLSNNVFEHLPDVDKALKVCRQLVKPDSGRIAIFSDPLFYSSMGSHLAIEPWEHLWGKPDDIKAKVEAERWKYFNELNKMTLVEFLNNIVRNNLVIFKLETSPDRNLRRLPEILAGIRPEVPLTDLTIEGISVELAGM